jgi:hypothetical protein
MENIKSKMIMKVKSKFLLPGVLFLTLTIKGGEKVFMEHCQRYHPHGEAGLGPAINPAPSFGKRFQIRHGVGAMPALMKSIFETKKWITLSAT